MVGRLLLGRLTLLPKPTKQLLHTNATYDDPPSVQQQCARKSLYGQGTRIGLDYGCTYYVPRADK